MKKIIFYIDNMRRNGAQRVIWTLLNNFSQRTNLEVVLVNDYDLSDKEMVFETSDLVRKYVLLSRKRNKLLSNIYRVLKIRDILIKEKPDVVLSFKGRSNYRIIMASLFLKSRLIVSVRNIPEYEYGTSWIKKLFTNLLFIVPDGCVFQNDSQREYFNRLIVSKSKVIVNPISSRFYTCKKHEGIRSGIVSTGRLEKQKNYPMLIKAFARIKALVEDDIYIYGVGEEEEYLKKLCDDLDVKTRVHFCSPVVEIERKLKQAKIYVLTSYFEGMPNALLEAMACGTACVATDSLGGGVRTLLANDTNMIVPVDDVAELANRMLKILTNDNIRKELENKVSCLAMPYKEEKVCQEWYQFLLGYNE